MLANIFSKEPESKPFLVHGSHSVCEKYATLPPTVPKSPQTVCKGRSLTVFCRFIYKIGVMTSLLPLV